MKLSIDLLVFFYLFIKEFYNMIKKRENEWIGTNLPIKIQRAPLSRLRMAMDLIFNSMACMVWQVDASHLISSHPIPLRLQPSFFPFSVAF